MFVLCLDTQKGLNTDSKCETKEATFVGIDKYVSSGT